MSVSFEVSVALLWIVAVTITLSQIMATYAGFELAIHKSTFSTYGLYLINLAVGTILLSAYWALSINPVVPAGLVIAVGLPTAVQSKFAIGGALGDGPWRAASRGLSVDLSPLYNSYASLFTREMDATVELLFRETVLPVVAAAYPDPKHLGDIAAEAVAARNFPESDRRLHLALIDTTVNGTGTSHEKTTILAKEVIRVMGLRYLLRLCASGNKA